MAGIRCHVDSLLIATSTVAKTILQIVAAANHRVLLGEIGIFFEGAVPTGTPIKVDLVRQSDAGTGSAAATVIKVDESTDETLQTTAIKGCTTEPTTTSIVWTALVHPTAGERWQAPLTEKIPCKGGTRLGLRVTAAASINCLASLDFEE